MYVYCGEEGALSGEVLEKLREGPAGILLRS